MADSVKASEEFLSKLEQQLFESNNRAPGINIRVVLKDSSAKDARSLRTAVTTVAAEVKGMAVRVQRR